MDKPDWDQPMSWPETILWCGAFIAITALAVSYNLSCGFTSCHF